MAAPLSTAASVVAACSRTAADVSRVAAAVHCPWRQGQTEGQINRLKVIKREMYGRAGFDLLRRRVLRQQACAP